jgi:hypothetical protein
MQPIAELTNMLNLYFQWNKAGSLGVPGILHW